MQIYTKFVENHILFHLRFDDYPEGCIATGKMYLQQFELPSPCASSVESERSRACFSGHNGLIVNFEYRATTGAFDGGNDDGVRQVVA